MSHLVKAGEILLAWGVLAASLVAVCLLAVGALGVAMCFGLAMVWEWLEERNCGY